MSMCEEGDMVWVMIEALVGNDPACADLLVESTAAIRSMIDEAC